MPRPVLLLCSPQQGVAPRPSLPSALHQRRNYTLFVHLLSPSCVPGTGDMEVRGTRPCSAVRWELSVGGEQGHCSSQLEQRCMCASPWLRTESSRRNRSEFREARWDTPVSGTGDTREESWSGQLSAVLSGEGDGHFVLQEGCSGGAHSDPWSSSSLPGKSSVCDSGFRSLVCLLHPWGALPYSLLLGPSISLTRPIDIWDDQITSPSATSSSSQLETHLELG